MRSLSSRALVAALSVLPAALLVQESVSQESVSQESVAQKAAPATPSAKPAVAPAAEPAAGTAPVDFWKEIYPVFVERCVECHGEEEPEADLRLDVREGLFHDDKEWWTVRPGDVGASVLIDRILLPADDPEAMPPVGSRLTKRQIQAMKDWIAAGAEWPEGPAPEQGAVEDAMVLPEIGEDARSREDRALAAIEAAGGLALRIAQEHRGVEVNLSLMGERADDGMLAPLPELADSLVWLNLSRTGITDSGLRSLAPLTQLRRLNLSRTGIGDGGLAALRGMAELEYLNLYGTGVTDAGLEHLAALPKLERLYLWQTGVTEDGADRLAAARPGLRIDRGESLVLPEPPQAVNSVCPVLSKPVQPTFTVAYKGELIGFCCAGCRAKFEKDKEPYLKGLEEVLDAELWAELQGRDDGPEVVRAANQTCPVSGQPVKPGFTSTYKESVVGFCCATCKGKFDVDPVSFEARLLDEIPALSLQPKPASAAAAKPVNTVCPVSGQPAKAEFTVEHEGVVVGLCCGNCRRKFMADPAAYAEALTKVLPATAAPAAEPANTVCPVSGQPVKPSFTVEHEGVVVGLCCANCRRKFVADPAAYADALAKVLPAPAGKAAGGGEEVEQAPVLQDPAGEPEPAGKPAPTAAPINVICPVTGRPVREGESLEHEGRRIGFASGWAVRRFRADPARFLRNLQVRK